MGQTKRICNSHGKGAHIGSISDGVCLMVTPSVLEAVLEVRSMTLILPSSGSSGQEKRRHQQRSRG